jgi:hypothetical protein
MTATTTTTTATESALIGKKVRYYANNSRIAKHGVRTFRIIAAEAKVSAAGKPYVIAQVEDLNRNGEICTRSLHVDLISIIA